MSFQDYISDLDFAETLLKCNELTVELPCILISGIAIKTFELYAIRSYFMTETPRNIASSYQRSPLKFKGE
jgi:hypothetical protein